MRIKLLFVLGIGVGYVLGARAGRPRYEQIKAKATEAWEDPRVQKVVADTQEFVKENTPVVQEKVVTGSKAAVKGAKESYAKAAGTAREVSGKVVGNAKDVSAKAAGTAKGVSGKVSTTAKGVSEKMAAAAKDASASVSKTAKDASAKATKAARDARGRIVDRGEGVVDGVIIAAGTARENALESDPDDDNTGHDKPAATKPTAKK